MKRSESKLLSVLCLSSALLVVSGASVAGSARSLDQSSASLTAPATQMAMLEVKKNVRPAMPAIEDVVRPEREETDKRAERVREFYLRLMILLGAR